MPLFNPRLLQGKARYLPDTQMSAPPVIDLERLYHHRLSRLRAEMAKRNIDACLLFDAVNIRYATGARNMQIFTSRNPASRYAFIPQEGNVVLFEFPGCEHLATGSIVDEVRPCVCASAVAADYRQPEKIKQWADDIADLMHACRGKHLAIEAATLYHPIELQRREFILHDAQHCIEHARAQKSTDEIECIRYSIAATDIGVAKLRDSIAPGMSENALWSLLHQSIIESNGDYIETRLMASGERINPWFQESSCRFVKSGDLVALDTDVVGPFGYYADYSRTFYCGTGKPSARQRTLYQTAVEQIEFNINLIKSGMSFREISEKAWKIPDKYAARRYFVLAHGVGMTGEYPYILHQQDFDDAGYDGILQPMTTLCLESYIGDENGGEGVKLEQQILVNDFSCELLSCFPFEDALQ